MNKQIDNNKNIDSSNIQDEKAVNELKTNKTLGVWLSLLSVFVVVLQVVFKLIFNFEIEVNIIIDCISLAVATLVVFGVIKTKNKPKDLLETQKEIKKHIAAEVDKISKKSGK